MGIGYLLLYVALAVVALWLMAELLLQNRAPLHWRAVALAGFLCVVAGMRLSSVVVIGAGAAAFAVGQVFVTLSVKRGYIAGWSLRRQDGSLPGPLSRVPLLSAATGGAVVAAAVAEPVGEVGPVEPEVPVAAYEMQELTPDEGVYAEEPAPYYQQQPEQPYYQPGYDQAPAQYADHQWQQQPAFTYDQSYGTQPQYQDPYGQPQYQDPYGRPVQQGWEYQQQPSAPEQQPAYGYQPQPWDYQQQG